MTDFVYLDTSSVLRWAFRLGGSPLPRDEAGHATFVQLLSGSAELAMSTITLIEVVTNLNDKVRDTNNWYASYDAERAETTVASLMALLKTGGRITTRDLGPRAFETAMMWVAEAVRVGGKRLGAWDALHLGEAVRWARELGDGTVVSIATSDSDFDDFLEIMPELLAHVALLDVCAS